MKTRYIFVTGGVISGIGKGVCAASVGYLLKSHGYSVFSMKLDPYLNVTPGLLSPIEHGEVYVTQDGAETDLDLGYYERFIGTNLTYESSYTSGKLYKKLAEKEQNGEYNGKTLQVVPHFTNEIQNVILNIEKKYHPDFAIIEIGGTVGDLESNPFFYAIAQLSYMYPKNVYFIHVSYLPQLETTLDYKTKPTQHSITVLRSLGINPNMIFLRSHKKINKESIEKISKISFVQTKNIVNIPDFKIIYQIPLYLQTKNIVKNICSHFNLKTNNANLSKWEDFVNKLKDTNKIEINLAMCGKYTAFEDAYKSIKEALVIASAYENIKINFKWVDLISLKQSEIKETLNKVDGIILLPGKEIEGWDNEVSCAKYARESNIPTLGICWGFQAMAYEFAKTINKNVKTIEFDTLTDKNKDDFINEKVKTYNEIDYPVRIGNRKIIINKNTKAYEIYNKLVIEERHKHRFCIKPELFKKYENDDAKISALNENKNICEIFEITSHPFYIGVQYHPEYNVKPTQPEKLFANFLIACKNGK